MYGRQLWLSLKNCLSPRTFAPVRRLLYLLAALLLLPALLINLDAMVFIDDEAIRSLVAQEMRWSGNYLAPTMHGDAYLNKPPAWNWILALSFWLHGVATEWSARLPTVVCLLGYAATVWAFSRRYFPNSLAVVHALTVVTCGRMLFWDSMLALIDVCFSWVTYVQIVVLYHYGRRDAWWRAFLFSYLLTALGFMLKGLPAVVFQGLSVLAILGWRRAWWQFVRLPHLLSGLLCVALLAGYYWAYSAYVDLGQVAERMFVESGKRTAVAHGWGDTLGHLLAFPFEMGYHFLPWTLLLPLLVLPGARAELRRNSFAGFCTVAFLVNIPVYWLSPNVYPRYLLMLMPLLFAPLLFLFRRAGTREQRYFKRAVTYLFLVAMGLATLLLPLVPLLPPVALVEAAWWKALGSCAPALLLTYLGWVDVRHRGGRNFLLVFACFLLVLRIVFNFFVLPPRAAGDVRGLAVRESAERLVARTAGDSLYVYGFTLIEPATGFYLSRARGRFVRRRFEGFDSTSHYIVSPLQYPELAVHAVDSLYLRHLNRQYPVGRLPDPPAGRAPLNELPRDGMGSGMMLR